MSKWINSVLAHAKMVVCESCSVRQVLCDGAVGICPRATIFLFHGSRKDVILLLLLCEVGDYCSECVHCCCGVRV